MSRFRGISRALKAELEERLAKCEREVFVMSDGELALGLAMIAVNMTGALQKMRWTEWARAFVTSAPLEFARFGQFTWRQRKAARAVLVDTKMFLIRKHRTEQTLGALGVRRRLASSIKGE